MHGTRNTVNVQLKTGPEHGKNFNTPVGGKIFFRYLRCKVLLLIFAGCLSVTLIWGGNANNGANAGLANANSNNTPANTNANIGSRQCFDTIFFTDKGPASWQKMTVRNGGVGSGNSAKAPHDKANPQHSPINKNLNINKI